jgi:7-carboxy-7-deazaguanine synthase
MTGAEPALVVSEIYLSVQGESTWAGCPCTFVRLTGCPLRCVWCDTEYAFYGGKRMALQEVMDRVKALGCPVVEVTGGEPLAQPACLALLEALVEAGFTVLLETSGAYPIAPLPAAVHAIMDLKCPGSGESHRNLWDNLSALRPHDEVKFVLADRADYEWAREVTRREGLTARCRAVLFSPAFGLLAPADLARWITEDGLFGVRMQLQMHKHIWPSDTKGV